MLIKKLLFGYYNTQCVYVIAELKIDDLHTLKAILHGKNNNQSEQILKKCADAMNHLGKVLVIDRIICQDEHHIDACINHINMLNVSNSGDRTLHEFQQIFNKVGFKITSIKKVQESLCIIELEKV